MKILHVITTLQTGGAEKLMVDLLPRFRQAGADVDLALFVGGDTPFRRELEKSGIRIIDFSTRGSVYNPLHALRLARLMRRYDIVHTHNYAPQLFAAIGSVLCSVVLCTTEHNTSNRRRGWRWYAPVDRRMYSRYDRIICISDKAEENLREYIGKSEAEIRTIYNGVDIERYATATPSDMFNNLPAGSRVIMQVAGFRWEKDQDTLIRAMKHLPDNFYLVFVGDGVRRHECEALAQSEGVARRILFLGVRTDVAPLLRAADYVVMSSHFEGLSLSSVEGMSVGHPFLASDVDGLREVVQGAGVLFPHGDSEAFARNILSLEANPEERSAVSARCRQRASRFDIDTMARAYMSGYQELIKNNRKK